MSTAYIKDLSSRPTSVVGDQIVQNLSQAVQSDGINPVSIDHSFYGIAVDGTIFTLATMTVTETGPNTNTGAISFNVFGENGNKIPVLDVGSDGMTVDGGFNVTGGSTTFETSSIEVEDKDLVLASGASTLTDLNAGGLILGTPESTTITLLYDSALNYWSSNVGINVATGNAITVGTDEAILNGDGLTIGDVSLTSGSLTLSSDVSLNTLGLEIGDISLSAASGLEIGTDITMNTSGITLGSTNPVVINTTGMSIGSDLSLNTTTGLTIGTDLSLTTAGGLEIGTDISLTVAGGLAIDDIALTSDGLTIGNVNPITLDQDGLSFTDLQLSTTTGLSIADDVTLTSTSLTIGPSEEVIIDNNGISLGSFGSFTKTGGLVMAGGSATLEYDSIIFGSVVGEQTIIDDTSVALGSDILMNHDGLYLTNENASVFLGGTKWKISYDSTTENLLFQFYDSVAGTYVTKTEIKNAS
jgi:hypothetical protein